jgi:hypothetical protein
MNIDLRNVALEGGDHVVHFYDREADLFGVVGQHLARVARAREIRSLSPRIDIVGLSNSSLSSPESTPSRSVELVG